MYDTSSGGFGEYALTGDIYCYDYAMSPSTGMGIIGNGLFHDHSSCWSYISGNADFWDSAYNYYGPIGGNFTYHAKGTINFGINGDLTGQANGGVIRGDLIIAAGSSPALPLI